MNTRNRLYYKRQKLDDESEKDVVTKDIISVTSDVDKIRKEIKLCDEVSDNARKMKRQIKNYRRGRNRSQRKKSEGRKREVYMKNKYIKFIKI